LKVLIDLYKVKDPFSGLGQFSLQFANALMDQHLTEIKFYFLLPRGLEVRFIPEPQVFRAGNLNRMLPFLNTGFDLWHSLQQFPSFFPDKATPQILTIHDLNFLKEKNEKKAAIYLKRLQKNINRASVITTISEYTRSEVMRHCDIGDKPLLAIHNGIQGFTGISMKPEIHYEKPFFFSIGIFTEKKNFHKLIEMLPFYEGADLVLAGRNSTEYGEKIKARINELGLNSRVHLVGMISDEVKRWYYENCLGFLFPSSAEGFGMPVIEAMQHGKPVILSVESSLPEIGGEEAFYFDSLEPEAMARVTKQAISIAREKGEEFVEKMRSRAGHFSWHRAIQSYIELYMSMLEK
jgi:glycosyltransferase involved in cell wall biosynthesis